MPPDPHVDMEDLLRRMREDKRELPESTATEEDVQLVRDAWRAMREADDERTETVLLDREQYTNLIDWMRGIKREIAGVSWMVAIIFMVIVVLPVLRYFHWLPATWDFWR